MAIKKHKINVHFSVEVDECMDDGELQHALYSAALIASEAAEKVLEERFARYRMVGYNVEPDESRDDRFHDPITTRWQEGKAKP
ncbi:hypothetical protein ACFRR6_24240 [Streptomyces sp. NPDC056891]|uniref:hypothetical protein n=1 Tax=Streptomyces sp. NPDC056891 TaxID=3345961 RepID=UPI0036D1C870